MMIAFAFVMMRNVLKCDKYLIVGDWENKILQLVPATITQVCDVIHQEGIVREQQ